MIKPTLKKADLIERSGITASALRNWHIRGYIPFSLLGVEKVNFRNHLYSPYVSAFIICMTYHKGPKKKPYFKVLERLFKEQIKSAELNEHCVVAISGFGSGIDAGAFQYAYEAQRLRQVSIVPVGAIIKREISLSEEHSTI